MRRSGEGEKGRCLPWSKEEEGAYIFWMKQVPVAVLTMSSMIPLTILSLDTDETVRNFSIKFSVALLCLVAHLFMFLLIFNEQRVPKITFVLVLTYYVKLHLFVILTVIGWFIINIQSDLFWHRCLGRQAFGTPRMYTLSPSKSIKGSNYGEFLNDKKMYCYVHDCTSTLQIWKVCLHSNMYAQCVHSDLIIHAFLLVFIA